MKDAFKGKSIILGAPDTYGIQQRFIENLDFLGFKLYPLIYGSNEINMPWYEHIIHNYRKIFFNDRTYKGIAKKNIAQKPLTNLIKNIPENVDYALFIRPDLYSYKTVNIIKNKSKNSAAYQWDGMHRYPAVKNYLNYFDRFYIFDINDLKLYPNTEVITNFYFDDLIDEPSQINNDVFFVGAYFKDRFESLQKLTDFFDNNNLLVNIFLTGPKDIITKPYNNKQLIKHVPLEMSFTENLRWLKKSKIILDFKNGVHYGLSLRTFEAVGYRKKLITSNPLVKYFDFYHPANIYVIENDNFEGLEDFINTPYEEIDAKIVEKYSFTNWLKNVLQIEPNIKITIPYPASQ